jgi:hypothetical protein
MNSFIRVTLAAFVFAGAGLSSVSGKDVPSIFSLLRPQEYTWYPQRSVSGPVLVFVSLPRQEAVVYRNGIRIGRASVSTGRDGHVTPTGVFQILEKDVNHRSKTYNNAPMPYMERLTWDGVALHAGFNPGHPASHGCVRLPAGFAKELYQVTSKGGTVIISNSRKIPTMTITDGFGAGGSASGASSFTGKPGGGAVSIVMSTTSQRMLVYQNGKKVGESSVLVRGGMRGFSGEAVYVFAGDQQWHRVQGNASVSSLKEEMVVPAAFGQKMRTIMRAGTTLVVTHEPLSARGGQSRGLITSQ